MNEGVDESEARLVACWDAVSAPNAGFAEWQALISAVDKHVCEASTQHRSNNPQNTA